MFPLYRVFAIGLKPEMVPAVLDGNRCGLSDHCSPFIQHVSDSFDPLGGVYRIPDNGVVKAVLRAQSPCRDWAGIDSDPHSDDRITAAGS